MKYIFIITVLFFLIKPVTAQQAQNEWLTTYERSNYKQTATYNEVMDYCTRLDSASDKIKLIIMGESPRGHKIPLLVIDNDGITQAADARKKNKIVFLIQSGIHAGEPEGVDASLMFARDIAIFNKYATDFSDVTLLIIPSYNVDGLNRFSAYNRINQNGPEKMGWRTNALNLNLNRDYLKADAPETQAWLKMFTTWLPDFFIDCHTTDGADYQYVLTYGMETFGNMHALQTNWQKKVFLPYFDSEMNKLNIPVFPYVTFRVWNNPESGLGASVASPMLSQGYTAVQNRIGFLSETHMLKDYKTRVTATYQLLKIVLQFLHREKNNLLEINKKVDDYSQSAEIFSKPFPVYYQQLPDSEMVSFKGVEYELKKSEITGGNYYIYHPDKPKTYQIPYFNKLEPQIFINLPQAYVFPPEWSELTSRLKYHNISFYLLQTETSIACTMYKIVQPKLAASSYESHQQVIDFDTEEISISKTFPVGSIVVPVQQRSYKILVHLLEPKADNSMFRWGFFNAIFEQKEYAETYVMEALLQKMFEQQPELKEEFESRKKKGEFGNNQFAMTNWLYSKTEYKDTQKDIYPVAKVFDKLHFEKLIANTKSK